MDMLDELQRARADALAAWLDDDPIDDTESSARLLRSYRTVAESARRYARTF